MLSVYKDKKVLITGHTGFKGSWLSIWLHKLGAEVIGLSDCIPSAPSNFEESNISSFIKDYRIDVCDTEKVKEVICKEQPDFIFHLAAQALVRPSYINPVETMKVNAIGSANVLDALRDYNKDVVILMITSDKAYDNVEWEWGYRETDALGGKDPYSASKGMAELVIRSYVESYFKNKSNIKVGITRAGNVIGGGDWARDRIVPDCMKAWSTNETVEIRSPKATRPWQHVLEPLSGYLNLGAALLNTETLHGSAFNFGPAAHNNQSVSDLIEEMKKYWKNVSWKDTSDHDQVFHEAGLLKLNCDKALMKLGWLPTLSFDETVEFTVSWYKEYYSQSSENMYSMTSNQIDKYTALAVERGISWTK
ncbi:CDP-glucose 4,6-dehydratase [Vibrio vulnificus]|uniref:CDP-glucose 4,6-dehydratase n=1 Tax=Vibrio vulnificus TaxID=672 RepID=UPI0028A57553|nr:CDP-glucose 4,6-dehydratase [Vibrio vulnificus]